MINPLSRQILPICFALALGACDSGSVKGPVEVAGIEIGAALDASAMYTVGLSGANALPPSDTRHTGLGEFAYDAQSNSLYGTVTTSVEVPATVHIHEGSPEQVGAVVVTLIETVNEAGNRVFNVPADFQFSQQQAELYQNGELYVDIHANGIELRAQLSAAQNAVVVAPTLDDIQAKVFTPMCSGCHTGGGNSLPSVLDLSNADATRASLVGVFAKSNSDVIRVEPGSADNSLLIHKIEGTQEFGARMPFRGAKLDAEIIAAIRQWINSGAER